MWVNAIALLLLVVVCSAMYLRAKPALSTEARLQQVTLPAAPPSRPLPATTASSETELLDKAVAAMAADNAKLKSELATADESISKLNRRLAERVAAATKPQPAPVEPATVIAANPAKFGEGQRSIGGSAWITRRSGASDLLRGLHIQVLKPTCPFQVYADCAEAAANEWDAVDKKDVQYFQQNQDLGPIPNNRLAKHRSITLHAVHLSLKEDPTLDVVSQSLKDTPNLQDFFAPVLKATSAGETTSSVDGKWKISGLPDGHYFIFARFDSAVYVEWLVPITVKNGKADPVELNLFNDNAAVTRG